MLHLHAFEQHLELLEITIGIVANYTRAVVWSIFTYALQVSFLAT